MTPLSLAMHTMGSNESESPNLSRSPSPNLSFHPHSGYAPHSGNYATGTGYNAGSKLEKALSLSEIDPLLLRSRLHPESDVAELTRRRSQRRGLGEFYERQNGEIESLLKPLLTHVQDAKDEEDMNKLAVRIAITGSLIANLVLMVIQLYAAVSSLSLSFFATAVDAIFDPAANLVLNYCHKRAQTVDLREYPSGGSRFTTIGEIIYSGVMGSASVILIAFSIQNIASHNDSTPKDELHVSAIIAVGIAFLTKLGLFIYCYSIRSKNSQVRVLWEDHRNDVAINAFGLFTSSAGVKIAWWIDPAGAMIISLALIYLWGSTCFSHFKMLAGAAAPLDFQRLVIYNAMHFADEIEAIDNCIAYHSGPHYFVEVDIVMNSQTPLWKAHDISQALQDRLEELPNVDRAYVHVDHDTDHSTEHRKTK